MNATEFETALTARGWTLDDIEVLDAGPEWADRFSVTLEGWPDDEGPMTWGMGETARDPNGFCQSLEYAYRGDGLPVDPCGPVVTGQVREKIIQLIDWGLAE